MAHCGLAIEELINQLSPMLTPEIRQAIASRVSIISNESSESKKSFERAVEDKWDQKPITPARMMFELSNALPDNSIVVDDSLSNRAMFRHYFQAFERGDIRGVRGQSIGGGIGATMGTQCANPDRPVFGVIGDGSAMMTIQGLWTAANDDIPCVFVICNNGMYRILRTNFNIYQKDVLGLSETSGENLLYSEFATPFDMAAIANSMGVHGERIIDPSEIKPAVDRAVASGKPALLDIIIDSAL